MLPLLKIAFLLLMGSLSVVKCDPPPYQEVAKMARYIIHSVDWVAITTISSANDTKSYPFVNLESISDGPVDNGTGVPYFYLTPIDATVVDLEKDNRAAILAGLSETTYCKAKQLDPEDPRCARLILTGTMSKVEAEKNKVEYQAAKYAMFSRHPQMKNWPKDHSWTFWKLNIIKITVQDYFGGVKNVSVEDYFNAPVDTVDFEEPLTNDIKLKKW